MKVVIRQKAGYTTREGLVFECGDSADLNDHVAVKLIQYGIASPAPAPKIEAAVKAAPHNTAKRVAKPAPSKAAPKEEAAAKDRKKA